MPLSPLGIAISQTQTQPAPARPGQIGPTDVLGAYKMATDQANAQYLAKLQQQNSLWGGLAGLGGSALTAGILKGNLFGAPTAAAAPAATPLASGAALPDIGNLAFDAGGAPVGITGVAPLASAVDSGAAGIPLAGLDATAAGTDLAGTAALDAGTVAGADAAAAAAPAVADAGATTLADLLPFLFAA